MKFCQLCDGIQNNFKMTVAISKGPLCILKKHLNLYFIVMPIIVATTRNLCSIVFKVITGTLGHYLTAVSLSNELLDTEKHSLQPVIRFV